MIKKGQSCPFIFLIWIGKHWNNIGSLIGKTISVFFEGKMTLFDEVLFCSDILKNKWSKTAKYLADYV